MMAMIVVNMILQNYMSVSSSVIFKFSSIIFNLPRARNMLSIVSKTIIKYQINAYVDYKRRNCTDCIKNLICIA